MEDYCSTKQTVGQSPKQQSVEEPQPEQSVSDLPSVGDASQNEKQRQLLTATKTATERNLRIALKKNACC